MAHANSSLDAAALMRLLEVVRDLAGPCELGELLHRVIEAGRAALACDRGSVFLYDAATRELYTTVATGSKEIRLSIDRGIAGECARTGQVIVVPDCYADERFNQDVDRATGYRTRSLIAAPLIGLNDQLVGVIQLLNPVKGSFVMTDEPLALALASQAAVAIQRARLMDEYLVKVRMERDLALAREIQTASLPSELPKVDGYDLASFSRPADETGGDIYDMVASVQPDGVDILLADAAGHGVGPAISVTQVRAMFRMGLRLAAHLDHVVGHINAQLCADIFGSRFVTAFLGRLHAATHVVHYHAAGQGPILHVHVDQASPPKAEGAKFEWHRASTLPLGVMDDAVIEPPEPIRLAPGDMLVLLTDGFYEAHGSDTRLFGNKGVEEVIRQNLGRPASDILAALVKGVDACAAGVPQQDDLTGIILTRNRESVG